MRIRNPILFSIICVLVIGVCGGLFYFLSTHNVFAPKETTYTTLGTNVSAVLADTTEPEESSTTTTSASESTQPSEETITTEAQVSETAAPSEPKQRKESKTSETKQSKKTEVTETKQKETKKEVPMEYKDAASFEATLNEGENLVGAKVHFTAREVVPDSAFGYNIWAGEHLNFVSPSNPNVSAGDKLIVKITGISRTMGSWILDYKMIDCNGKGDVSTPTETTPAPTESETSQTETTSAKEYMSANEFEAALNRGENCVGAIVHFTADQIEPDSAFGYNIWAGDHLNFCSTLDPHVSPGDSLTVKITSVENVWGSWIIAYKKI